MMIPQDTFIDIFQKYSFPTYFFNSLLAAGVSTLVSLLFYAMGAYVIAKFEFPGRKLLFALFTITLLVPSHSKTQPIFSLITKLNLYDSIWGVTLVYLSAGMAMSIFVLKAGFMAIPKSLDEAATLDGASFFRTFWTINLPLVKSALATAGILMFLGNWNEYYFGDLHVVEDQLRRGGGANAHLVIVVAELKALPALLHDESGDAPGADVRRGDGQNHIDIRLRGAGTANHLSLYLSQPSSQINSHS